MSAPAFVAASTALSADNATPWTLNPAFPTGTTTDDIVFAICLTGNSSATITPSGSFASIAKITGTNVVAEWFWDRVESGDDTTPNFSSNSGPFFVALITYRGCIRGVTPYEDATTAGETGSTTPASAQVTPTCFESTVISLAAIEDDTAWTTAPPPANWTSRLNVSSGTGTDGRVTAIELTTSPTKGSNVNAVNFGTLSASEYWATLTLVLKPHSIGPINADRRSFIIT